MDERPTVEAAWYDDLVHEVQPTPTTSRSGTFDQRCTCAQVAPDDPAPRADDLDRQLRRRLDRRCGTRRLGREGRGLPPSTA